MPRARRPPVCPARSNRVLEVESPRRVMPEQVVGEGPGVERRAGAVLGDPVADGGGEGGGDLLLVGGDADAQVRVADQQPQDEGDGDPAGLALLRGREHAEAGGLPALHDGGGADQLLVEAAGGTGFRR
jgi:hypothetical protein